MKSTIYFILLAIFLLFEFYGTSSHRLHHKTKNHKTSRKLVISSPEFYRFLEKDSSISMLSQDEGDITPNSSMNILKEGWLRISSMQLYSTLKYPDIPLPNRNFAKVEVVRQNLDNKSPNNFYSAGSPYRKNSHFGTTEPIPSQDSFWFRLSGSYLYYTESKLDMIVLGAISVSSIKGTTKSSIGTNCFQVNNAEKLQWDLCTSNDTERSSWVCAISQAIGRPCGPQTQGPVIIQEKQIVKQPIILIPLPSPYCNEEWNYGRHGTDWNCKCSEGFMQSPIDVQRKCVISANITSSFSFFKVSTELLGGFYENNMFVIRCKDGSAEDCDKVSFGSIIDQDYAEYSCHEIRFHTPGEHTIDGRKFPMEIQMIFHPTTEGDYKKKAGIAFVVEQVPGKTNPFFDFMEFLELPNIYKTKMSFEAGKEVDVEQLFQDQDDDYEYNGYFNYWRYEGSLTSPPCDEHVRWFIVEKPVKLGYAAMEMVKDVLKIQGMQTSSGKYLADLRSPPNPDGNSRDLQLLRDRAVYYFDMATSSCVPLPRKRMKRDSGHYEKVTRQINNYMFVNGDKPSGIEGALVVPKWEAVGSESPEDQLERDRDNIFQNNE